MSGASRVWHSIRRTIYIYFRCLSQQVKSILAYEADFWILVLSAVVVQFVGFAFIWTVFQQIPTINGWSLWEVVTMYALIFLTEGVGSLFFEGTWMLGWTIWHGDFDIMLIRPVSPILLTLSQKVGMNGVGNIATGTVLLSINLATAASAFWTRNPFSAVPMFAHQMGDFAKYPLTIYSLAVQVAIVVAVPFAFVSFFPTAVAFGEDPFALPGLFTPLVAAYCAFMAVAVFKVGMRRYESVGH